MPYIKDVLLEEYNRMDAKLRDYHDKSPNQRRDTAIAALRVDMAFIQNAFRGNGLDIEQELFKYQARR